MSFGVSFVPVPKFADVLLIASYPRYGAIDKDIGKLSCIRLDVKSLTRVPEFADVLLIALYPRYGGVNKDIGRLRKLSCIRLDESSYSLSYYYCRQSLVSLLLHVNQYTSLPTPPFPKGRYTMSQCVKFISSHLSCLFIFICVFIWSSSNNVNGGLHKYDCMDSSK